MISLNSPTLRFTGITLLNPHRAVIPDGVTVIIGPNGAGKSSLARIIEGGWNFMTNDISTDAPRRPRVKIIEFSDIHTLTGFKSTYYQQRFEAGMNDETPTVADLFADKIGSETWQRISAAMRLGDIADRRANCLSSGELRKVLIANMLFDLPDVLVLDNPYIGLDAQSRPVLDDTIAAIAERGISVVMLVGNPGEVPPSASTVIPMSEMTIGEPIKAPMDPAALEALFATEAPASTPTEAGTPDATPGDTIVEMHDVGVRYGDRVIFDHLDWEIRQGECWALSGPNGSGKSTLLSLINADNPQAYCNDITLFGRRRGSGESIWDIKSRIAYVSPEMHLYFQGYNNTLCDVVAAGLTDTVGFYQRITAEMADRAHQWLRRLGIDHLADRRFSTLSYGEQRLGLLARTFIKEAPLMILDEPLHGLDRARKRMVTSIIDSEIRRRGSTLIYVTHYTPEIPPCVARHKSMGQ